MMNRLRSSRGYSLTELLVVMAIIGIMSLITVPAFINYFQSAKMKASMRQFTNDVRSSRQRAITQNHPTMISFLPGASGANAYRDFDGTVGGATYTQRGDDKKLDKDVWFATSSSTCVFDDVVTAPAATNGWNDIIFLPNGTVQNAPAPTPPCNEGGQVLMKINARIMKPQITVNILGTGRIRVQ